MCETVVVSRRRITRPGQLGQGFTSADACGLYLPGEYLVQDCIIDLSEQPLQEIDEAVSVIWGASATFRRCVIRGAGKLVLCGSGDADRVEAESTARVLFEECLMEDFGRRGVEAQAGTCVGLFRCLIRNWGTPSRHTVRDFAGWTHHGGHIAATECVFWQDTFWRPLRQFRGDLGAHLGQAWHDEGWRGLLRPSTYLPGVCRGLLATAGGEAAAWRCWRNHWWIAFPWRRTTAMMPDSEALALVHDLESMAALLEAELSPEARG